MRTQLNRRQFVSGLSLAGLAAVGTGLTGCASPNPSPSSQNSGSTKPNSGHRWEVKPDPIPDDQIAQTLECDVLVIGAGAAGVITAYSACENGAKVIVLEKTDSISSRGHDIGCINSRAHKELGIELDPAQIRNAYSQLVNNKVDMRLFDLWLNNSGAAVDHYLDIMDAQGIEHCVPALDEVCTLPENQGNPCIEAFRTGVDFGKEGASVTEDGEKYMHRAVRILSELGTDMGVEFMFSTPAEQLVQDESGKVLGAVAKNSDGEYIKVLATKGTVLATGGIGQSEEMLREWCPAALRFPANVLSDPESNTGDGLCMGLWAGGARQFTNPALMTIPVSSAPGGSFAEHYGWLRVNLEGKRFFNEMTVRPAISYGTAMQPQALTFSLFDARWKEKILQAIPSGLVLQSQKAVPDNADERLQKDLENGVAFSADSLEELAEMIGCPADELVATVNRYNELCAKGKDEDFRKDAQFLTTVDTPPYYASRNKTGVLVVMYGLHVDAHLRVCDFNDNPIEGLYAVGNCQGDFFTDLYPFLLPGISHGRALTFGHLIGAALAKGHLA